MPSNVLVVDDDPNLVRLMSKFLTLEGFADTDTNADAYSNADTDTDTDSDADTDTDADPNPNSGFRCGSLDHQDGWCYVGTGWIDGDLYNSRVQ